MEINEIKQTILANATDNLNEFKRNIFADCSTVEQIKEEAFKLSYNITFYNTVYDMIYAFLSLDHKNLLNTNLSLLNWLACFSRPLDTIWDLYLDGDCEYSTDWDDTVRMIDAMRQDDEQFRLTVEE